MVIFGSPAYFSEGAPRYEMRKNDYYITDVVLHVSEEFHKHGIENPKVAYPDWMVYEMCQYDPSIISPSPAVFFNSYFSYSTCII